MKKFAVKVNKHPRRTNNAQVNVMYELYLDGRSLRQIAAMFKKTHQSVCNMLKSRGYELRQKQFKGMQTIDGHRFTLRSGGYLRGTVDGRRITASRYVWEKHRGPVPPGYRLFYIDANKANNDVANLKLIPITDMLKVCNPTGYRGAKRPKGALIDRVRTEREARWQRAMAI
jgi:HNH endonuclease